MNLYEFSSMSNEEKVNLLNEKFNLNFKKDIFEKLEFLFFRPNFSKTLEKRINELSIDKQEDLLELFETDIFIAIKLLGYPDTINKKSWELLSLSFKIMEKIDSLKGHERAMMITKYKDVCNFLFGLYSSKQGE